MSEMKTVLRTIARGAHRALQVARLVPSWPLLLLLAPMLGALVLASGGMPTAGSAVGSVLALLSLWGTAWTLNDLINAQRGQPSSSLVQRGVLTRQQALGLLVALVLVVLLAAYLLGGHYITLFPVALLVAFTYPWLRKYTYLIDAWFGLGIAWAVPLAYGAVGHWPDKVGALLGVVVLLWAMGWMVLFQWPRQQELMERGMRTLGLMFGDATGYLVMALQISVLLGAWMAGSQAGFGTLYSIELLLAAALIIWQAALLYRQGNASVDFALRLHLLSGAAIWLGVVLHYLIG